MRYTDSILTPQIYFSLPPSDKGGGLRAWPEFISGWGCYRYSNLGFFKSTAGCLL